MGSIGKELPISALYLDCRADGTGCVECLVTGDRSIVKSPKGNQAYIMRRDKGGVIYFNNHDVVVPDHAESGPICLPGQVEDFLTAPLLPETAFPFPGEIIDFKKTPSLLMSSQRGKAWDQQETCVNCWYIGKRATLGSSWVEIVHMGKPWYYVLPIDASPGESGVVCLAGLRSTKEAAEAHPLETPETSRCFQRTSRKTR